jgi:hypothetical protein
MHAAGQRESGHQQTLGWMHHSGHCIRSSAHLAWRPFALGSHKKGRPEAAFGDAMAALGQSLDQKL